VRTSPRRATPSSPVDARRSNATAPTGREDLQKHLLASTTTSPSCAATRCAASSACGSTSSCAASLSPTTVRPVFHAKVFQWWNINSLLQAATTQMPSGVSLNLIRDRDAFQSYFVFCIRNGANLFVLSDAPEYATRSKA
jgi:hypothetical protein